VNGNSSLSNSNSFGTADRQARTLCYWFRMAMPVPVTNVGGIG
jgi:hypothetical protein